MKKRNLIGCIALGVLSLWATACSKNDNPTPPVEEASSRYVLITLADRVSGNKGGFISSFATYPTGVISNATANSLEGQGMGGWRVHNNMIFKMFSTAGYVSGIEKLRSAKMEKSQQASLSLPRYRQRLQNTLERAILLFRTIMQDITGMLQSL